MIRRHFDNTAWVRVTAEGCARVCDHLSREPLLRFIVLFVCLRQGLNLALQLIM